MSYCMLKPARYFAADGNAAHEIKKRDELFHPAQKVWFVGN